MFLIICYVLDTSITLTNSLHFDDTAFDMMNKKKLKLMLEVVLIPGYVLDTCEYYNLHSCSLTYLTRIETNLLLMEVRVFEAIHR